MLHKSHTVISIVTYFLNQAKHRLDKPCPFLNINESVAPLVALVDHLLKSCTDHSTGWVCQMIVYQSHELSLSISALIESSKILDVPNKAYCSALSWGDRGDLFNVLTYLAIDCSYDFLTVAHSVKLGHQLGKRFDCLSPDSLPVLTA